MAFRFEFDSIHRVLRIKFSETVTNEDLIYFYRMSTLLVESLDPLSAIIDFAAVTSFESSADFMRNLAALPPAMPKQERPRVVIAPADHVFGLARLFGTAGEATRPSFHVVRTEQQAWAILGIQEEPEFKPVQQALESERGKPER
jgi:hypothetical protein